MVVIAVKEGVGTEVLGVVDVSDVVSPVLDDGMVSVVVDVGDDDDVLVGVVIGVPVEVIGERTVTMVSSLAWLPLWSVITIV